MELCIKNGVAIWIFSMQKDAKDALKSVEKPQKLLWSIKLCWLLCTAFPGCPAAPAPGMTTAEKLLVPARTSLHPLPAHAPSR